MPKLVNSILITDSAILFSRNGCSLALTACGGETEGHPKVLQMGQSILRYGEQKAIRVIFKNGESI